MNASSKPAIQRTPVRGTTSRTTRRLSGQQTYFAFPADSAGDSAEWDGDRRVVVLRSRIAAPATPLPLPADRGTCAVADADGNVRVAGPREGIAEASAVVADNQASGSRPGSASVQRRRRAQVLPPLEVLAARVSDSAHATRAGVTSRASRAGVILELLGVAVMMATLMFVAAMS